MMAENKTSKNMEIFAKYLEDNQEVAQRYAAMTPAEKKEFEEIEDVIMNLETNLNQIEEQMNGVTDFKEIDELSRQRDDLQKQIDEKNERYIYLLELQEQIDNQ